MNRVVTEGLGNARDITLLGGRLQLKDGNLTLGEKDLLHNDTSYYYVPSPSGRDAFLRSLRQKYVNEGEAYVFEKASVNYRLKYVPVLKCGNKILTLNSEDDYFITDKFFERPHSWHSDWDSHIAPVANGCLRSSECYLLSIKLSYKEISYLAPRLGLPLSKQLQVVLLPFHVATITSGRHEYHAAQVAIGDECLVCDHPQFEDSTFSAMAHALCLLAIYGTGAAFVLTNSDQIKPFIESYAKWVGNNMAILNLDDILDSYIPLLYIGRIIGVLLNIVEVILLVILMAGIVPAIALVVPSIASTILAFCMIWSRRVYLRIKKAWLFDKAVET